MPTPRGIDKGGISYHIETSGQFRSLEQFRGHIADIKKDLQEIKKLKSVLKGTSKVSTKAATTQKQITSQKKKQSDIEKQILATKIQAARLRNRELSKARKELAILKAKKSEESKRAVLKDKQVRKQRMLTDTVKEEERIARRLNILENKRLQKLRTRLTSEQAILKFKQKQADFERRATFARKSGLVGNAAALGDLGFSKARATAMGLMPKETKQEGFLQRIATRIKGIGKSAQAANGPVNRLGLSLQRMVTAFIFFSTARRIIDFFKEMVGSMIQFNSKLEQVRLGMASLFLAVGTVVSAQGDVVKGAEGLQQAMRVSRQQTQLLRKEALKTVATFDQLAETFQVAIAPGLQAGLDLDQIRKFTVQISQAAAAIGLPQQQLAEEIRSIMAGTISIRQTRIAAALGITNKDIRNAKQMGRLADFLQEKFQAFTVAGEKAMMTFSGIITNLKDALLLVAGAGGENLFDTIKEQLLSIKDLIVDPDTLTPNPEAVKAFEVLSGHLSDIVTNLIQFITKGNGLAKITSALDLLGNSAKTLMDVLLGVSKALGTIFTFVNWITKQLGVAREALNIGGGGGQVLGKFLVYGFILKQTGLLQKAISKLGTMTWALRTKWLAVGAAIAVATVNVTKLTKQIRAFSEERKVSGAEGAAPTPVAIGAMAASEIIRFFGGDINEEALQRIVGGKASGKADPHTAAKVRADAQAARMKKFTDQISELSDVTIMSPLNMPEVTENVENIRRELDQLNDSAKQVGGSFQSFLDTSSKIDKQYSGSVDKVKSKIESLNNTMVRLRQQQFSLSQDAERLESRQPDAMAFAKRYLTAAKTGDTSRAKDLFAKVETLSSKEGAQTILNTLIMAEKVEGRLTQTLLEKNRLTEISENLNNSILALKKKELSIFLKSTEMQTKLSLNQARLSGIDPRAPQAGRAREAIGLLEERKQLLEDQYNLRIAEEEKAKELKTNTEEVERLNRRILDLEQQRSNVIEEINGKIQKQNDLIRQVEDPESGFTDGIRKAADEAPALYDIYMKTGERIANGLGDLLGKAVTDALDPSKKVDLKSRFLSFFRDIANMFIQEMIRAQIVKFIGGAVGAGFSTGGGVQSKATGGLIQSFASGGDVLPRPSNIDPRDTVPAWLRPGEFVIRPEAVRTFGSGFFAMLNNGFKNPMKALGALSSGVNLRSSAIRGFAEGGAVGEMVPGSGTSMDHAVVTPVLTTDGELMEQILQGGGDAVLRDWMEQNSDSVQTSDRRGDRGFSYG